VKASALISGVFLILIVLWDAFETIILSRRVSRKLRLTRLFYWLTWRPWRALALRMRRAKVNGYHLRADPLEEGGTPVRKRTPCSGCERKRRANSVAAELLSRRIRRCPTF